MSVTLDGSTAYWRSTSFAVADGKAGTIAAWFYLDNLSAVRTLLASTDNASSAAGLSLAIATAGAVSLVGRNSSDTIILLGLTASGVVAAATWYLVLVSWDLSSAALSMYVNDTDVTPASPTLTDDTLDYTQDQLLVGATDSAGGKTLFLDGALDYVYFATSFIDLSVEANRRLFYGASGEAISLGPGAARPLDGTKPELFLAGGPGNFGANAGTGGSLASFGSPTKSYGRPAAVETLSRGFRGDEWRESERSGIPFAARDLVIEPATGLEVARREYSTDRGEIARTRHYRNLARSGR